MNPFYQDKQATSSLFFGKKSNLIQMRTGKPVVLQFMESQRVGNDLVTEKQMCTQKCVPKILRFMIFQML